MPKEYRNKVLKISWKAISPDLFIRNVSNSRGKKSSQAISFYIGTKALKMVDPY